MFFFFKVTQKLNSDAHWFFPPNSASWTEILNKCVKQFGKTTEPFSCDINRSSWEGKWKWKFRYFTRTQETNREDYMRLWLEMGETLQYLLLWIKHYREFQRISVPEKTVQEQTQPGESLTNLFVHLHRTLRWPLSQTVRVQTFTLWPASQNKPQYTFTNKNAGYCEGELETTRSKLKASMYKHLYGCLSD